MIMGKKGMGIMEMRKMKRTNKIKRTSKINRKIRIKGKKGNWNRRRK